MELQYRQGTIDDKDKLQSLGILSFGQYKSSISPENWEEFHTPLLNPETFTLLMDTSTCFLCEQGNEIVGMAYLVSNGHPTDMFEENWSYLRMVGVNPGFEGRGIAKKLTQMCIDYAKETGESFVALHTSEFMHAARHMYENFGFEVVKDFTRYGKKYWIYLLELDTK